MTDRHPPRPAALAARLAARLAALLLLAAALLAIAAEPLSYPQAVGIMKREQTAGESGAGLLKTFGKGDVGTFAQGIRLYSAAQADFNALIETLKAGLIADARLTDSPDLTRGLVSAADKRIAFTDCVDGQVLPQAGPPGTRSLAAFIGAGGLVGSAVELIGILKDTTIEVWKEYRAADKERRTQILEQLDGLKWRSFGEVPALG
jgi:hypothetical protein